MEIGMGKSRRVPLATMGLLAWLMVGCVYLPWFEQAQLGRTKRDFRELADGSAKALIVDRRITRDGVLRLLGEPTVRSSNDRVWAYTLTTSHGVWVEPLCLNAAAGGRHLYALGLRFDAAGVLEHHLVAVEDVSTEFWLFKQVQGTGSLENWPLAKAMDAIDVDNAARAPDPAHPYESPRVVPGRDAFILQWPNDRWPAGLLPR